MAKGKPKIRIGRELQKLFSAVRAEVDIAAYKDFVWEGHRYRMFRIACSYNGIRKERAVLDTNILGNDVKILLGAEGGSYVIEDVYMRNERGRYESTDKTFFVKRTKPFGKDDVTIRNCFRQLRPYEDRVA